MDIGMKPDECRLPAAVLLLGPTGAGKTPLGDLMEQRGLWSRRCHHFDFGAHLRAAADAPPPSLDARAVGVIRHALATGALLEDRDFPIAAAVLRSFLARRGVGGTDLVILNGLPRHSGQADGVAALLRVAAVVALDCSEEAALARIRLDTGGDRGGRADDDEAAVRSRLATYRARTAPLLDHYRRKGVSIVCVTVGSHTTPARALADVEAARPGSLEKA